MNRWKASLAEARRKIRLAGFLELNKSNEATEVTNQV